MVILKIPQNIGELDENGQQVEIVYKQCGSLPITMGMQKDLARYGREMFALAKTAQALDGKETDESALEAMDTLLEKQEAMYDAKASLIQRAFGSRFTLDELMTVTADEIDRVIAQLQLEANGVARKNA
jgi:hypothetical protein